MELHGKEEKWLEIWGLTNDQSTHYYSMGMGNAFQLSSDLTVKARSPEHEREGERGL